MKKKIPSQSRGLPVGVAKADLKQPSWKKFGWQAYKKAGLDWDQRQFELWFTTAFGWCVPTLRIGSSGYRTGRTGAQQRTYAVTVDGKVVRIGAGPHVLETLRVYVTPANYGRLKKFLDLRTKGAGDAGQIRDRISTRRAQGQMERAAGHSYWRWNA